MEISTSFLILSFSLQFDSTSPSDVTLISDVLDYVAIPIRVVGKPKLKLTLHISRARPHREYDSTQTPPTGHTTHSNRS